MSMQSDLVIKTTGWVLSSDGEYLKREVLPEDTLIFWKLTVLSDYCSCNRACWSYISRGINTVHVHPCT